MTECGAIDTAIRIFEKLGFAMAIAVYLLFRFDGLIRKNTDALHGLRRAIAEYGVGTRGGAPGKPPSGFQG